MSSLLSAVLFWVQALVCGTDLARALEEAQYPQVAIYRQQLDSIIAGWTQNYMRERRLASDECPQSEYIIPVVVHIIHSGAGQADSLPLQRVYTQMDHLFNDYRHRPYSKGYGSGVDTRIEFSLATRDPQGNPHPGVTYTHFRDAGLSSSTVIMGGVDANGTTLKRNVGWDRSKYLNIWVVGRICSGSSDCRGTGDVLGFAFFPGGSPEVDQGVVITADYFGQTIRGQTTTHEIGHYLNLFHPFQLLSAPEGGCEGMSDNDCLSRGDRVCDTPPTRQANYRAARRQNTCAENISALGGDKPDLIRNFMDYLDDSSLDLFTAGQMVRMHASLSRAPDRQQWQPSNLQAVGAGPWGQTKANFALAGCEQPPCVVCPEQPLYFQSYSMGAPHIFRWEIRKGAEVVAYSEEGPCATLTAPAQPDTYSVKLFVQNQATSAETTYTSFLIVRNPQQVVSYPFVEDFEGRSFPPAGWQVINPDFALRNSNLTWNRFQGNNVGSYGGSNAAVRIRNYLYFNYGQRDYLISPPIQIPSTAVNPTLAFDIYYRAVYWGNNNNRPLLYGDTLAVYISKDCGQTWERLYEQGGEELDVTGQAIQADSGAYPAELQPPSGPNGDWRRKKVPIPDTYKGQVILIRFENRTGMGNTLYLDSIQVADGESIASALSYIRPEFTFYPNPLRGDEGHLIIQHVYGSTLGYKLISSTGQVLREVPLSPQNSSYLISFAGLPEGVYLLVITANGEPVGYHRVLRLE